MNLWKLRDFEKLKRNKYNDYFVYKLIIKMYTYILLSLLIISNQ